MSADPSLAALLAEIEQFERLCATETWPLDFELVSEARSLLAAAARALRERDWQPIETAPKDEECLFWVVPKLPEESYTDTSGKPIVSMTGVSYIHRGKLKTWGALGKATHWILLPRPPALASSVGGKSE